MEVYLYEPYACVHSGNFTIAYFLFIIISRKKNFFFFDVTAEARVQSQAIPRGICGGQIGTGVGFPATTSVFLNPYHSTIAPY
jgi:hypothetical protein